MSSVVTIPSQATTAANIDTTASPRYVQQFGLPMSPNDLPRHRVIHYRPSLSDDESIPWEWTAGSAYHSLRMDGTVTVDNAENHIACCLAGLDMIQVPAFDVQTHLAKGELLEILPNWTAPAMPIQLVHPYKQYPPRRLHIFNDWLSRLLALILEQS